MNCENIVCFEVKTSPDENYAELQRCIATGKVIQINDTIDLSESNGNIRSIEFDGETLKFTGGIGGGQFTNCLLKGKVYIEAGRYKIFDNVFFHTFQINGVSQINENGIFQTKLVNTERDIFNLSNKTLSSSSLSVPFNPFETAFTFYKIDSFFTPELEGGEYVYKENGKVKLKFVSNGNRIRLPVRKDYVFTNTQGNVIESTIDLDTKKYKYEEILPTDLKVSRLFFSDLNKEIKILNEIRPEWFGAVANSQNFDNKDALQKMHLLSGTYQYAPNSTYYSSGDIRVYGDTLIYGNRSSLKLLDNTDAKCLYEIETKQFQDGINIYDLNFDGNKENNSKRQDGIYADLYQGIAPFTRYSFDNTYWYNLNVKNFTGTGINCACPGTSHIYSSYFDHNGIDGVAWAFEHFTLNNCTAWNNSRHGALASGNHWRIIGGAFAHNGSGSNVHCIGAFESQIIGCSLIHTGRFFPETGGGYIASTENVYGYIWDGQGQGTHRLDGGNGFYFEDCRDITMVGVRVVNHNRFGIEAVGNCARLQFAGGIIKYSNMVMNPAFSDIGGDSSQNVIVASTVLEDTYIERGEIMYFGTQSTRANWADLKGTLNGFGPGTFHIRDSWDAKDRPQGATPNLVGKIDLAFNVAGTTARVFIDVMDENCKNYRRHFNIIVSSGVYENDTGWV